jgi:Tol biopolymer transport system component/tRNA A-37 threonylcarbamoyl transferase component Bud32
MIDTTLGHFRITAKLGEGGMGEVWRAEDTRLGREVAIKVLPERFVADPERLARFEREARVLASLSHPHVAGIFEVGEAGDVHYLVMELVEGETLAERIARGALPAHEALPVALQIAEALEAAHARGIVHRDLKPANVKVDPAGRVKVLDFGLAKAMEPEPGSASASVLAHSPTLTRQATQAGVLMGTAAYMSPEQARGLAVDRRSDIWAFGVLLYEMLTGRLAFQGDTVSDTLASVLKTDTEWALLPPGLHPELRRLMERCLEKDRDRRLHDVADARIVLADAVAGRLETPRLAEAVAVSMPARLRYRALAAAAITGAALAALAGYLVWPEAPRPPLRKTEIAVADAGTLRSTRVGPAISPDGRWVAYGSEGRLWLRDLQAVEARDVPGGEGAARPFWSPDSRWLGFAVGDRLWKAPVGGGAPTAIAKLPSAFSSVGGAAWLLDGRIVFTTGGSGLYWVSDQGGDPRPLLEPEEGEPDFHDAAPLPGGRGVVFVVHGPEAMDSLALYAEGERRELLRLPGETLLGPVYAPTGHLLYERGTTNPGIWALPFSLARLEATAEPFLVAPNDGTAHVSQDGTLVYVTGVERRRLQYLWMDREGRRLGEIGAAQDQSQWPSLSPDGKRLVTVLTEGGGRDLWVHDTERGTSTRLTFDGEAKRDPRWSPDGRQVIYAVGEGVASFAVVVKDSDGTGAPRELARGLGAAFTPDGGGIVYAAFSPETTWDIWLLSPLEGEPTRLVQGTSWQYAPRVSPSGEYLAYVSRESGRDEIYLTRFPSGTGRWQVSVAGGNWPQWSDDGSRLYYIEHGGLAIMEVAVTTEPALSLAQPRRLFAAPGSGRTSVSGFLDGFAVTGNGERFLVVEAAEQGQTTTGITVVQSWFEEFRRR